MQALLAFFQRYFHWLLFLVLEVASGVMLFKYNSYQGSVWLSSANTVTGKVNEWGEAVSQFFFLRQANEELTHRNIFLEQEVQRLRDKLSTTAVTDTIAMLSDSTREIHAPLKLVSAKVVSNRLNSPDNLITIDCGEADGVKPNMGVASGNGLVGVVYMTGQHYSIVLPVLNRRSHISCSIRHTDYFGYLNWDGTDTRFAYLDDIPRHAKFEEGDWVVTSGFSHVFPKGIAVGKIVGIYDSADGMSYKLKIHLATDFGCLRDVCVIADEDIAERLKLQEEAADSLTIH